MRKPVRKWPPKRIDLFQNYYMNYLIRISFLLGGITPALFTSAQTGNTELKNIINQSFSYFPVIKEQDQAVVLRENSVQLARDGANPTVSGDASYNYMHPQSYVTLPLATPVTVKFQPANNYNLGVRGSYNLYDFGRVKADVEKAKTALQTAKHNVDATRFQLAAQIATTYYNMVYLQQSIAIQDSILRFLYESRKVTESLLRHGEALQFDVLSINSNIDQEKNQRASLVNALDKEKEMLAYASGADNISGTAFDFENSTPGFDSALAAAQRQNPEFTLLQDKINQSKADLAAVKLQYKPSLTAAAGTGFKNGYAPQINSFLFNYYAGVTLGIPIYNGNRTKDQVRIASSQMKMDELGVAALQNTYSRNIKQALTDIATNREQLTQVETQITEAKAALQMAMSRYRNGKGTNLELTNASTNVQKAELFKLQYQYQLCLANVQLARLTGTRFW